MRPTFGVALRQFLFGPADGAAEAELHDRITSAARRWEPTAVIREMRPVIEAERGVIGFDVRFTLRGDPDMIVSDAFVRVGGSVVETSG
jgi:phage baseplate assembly protein W